MDITKVSSRKPIRAFKFLFDTNAPFCVYSAYIKTFFDRKNILTGTYKVSNFEIDRASGAFSNDWFRPNIPYWHKFFVKFDFYDRAINTLEIGSWEGMSSLYILSELSLAKHVSVDTWAGADEHQGSDTLKFIENNFDNNTAKYIDRLTKFKGTSFNFFNSIEGRENFDLIYIDGSHHTDDVIIDAIKSFEQLKIGGLMIFDDYFWVYYKNAIDNPAGAVNAFLRLKLGCYEILAVYGQLILRKLSDGRRLS
jgi:hypothetical protein